MKMRSSTASWGICISGSFRRGDSGGEQMSQPHRTETEHDRKHDVETGAKPFAVARQIERLQAERRKRGVAAANPEHKKCPERRRNQPASPRIGHGGKKTDGQ